MEELVREEAVIKKRIGLIEEAYGENLSSKLSELDSFKVSLINRMKANLSKSSAGTKREAGK